MQGAGDTSVKNVQQYQTQKNNRLVTLSLISDAFSDSRWVWVPWAVSVWSTSRLTVSLSLIPNCSRKDVDTWWNCPPLSPLRGPGLLTGDFILQIIQSVSSRMSFGVMTRDLHQWFGMACSHRPSEQEITKWVKPSLSSPQSLVAEITRLPFRRAVSRL